MQGGWGEKSTGYLLVQENENNYMNYIEQHWGQQGGNRRLSRG